MKGWIACNERNRSVNGRPSIPHLLQYKLGCQEVAFSCIWANFAWTMKKGRYSSVYMMTMTAVKPRNSKLFYHQIATSLLFSLSRHHSVNFNTSVAAWQRGCGLSAALFTVGAARLTGCPRTWERWFSVGRFFGGVLSSKTFFQHTLWATNDGAPLV